MEILRWIQDLSEYIRVSRRRGALRQLGKGTDYAAAEHTTRQIVERLHPTRMRLRVAEIIEETASTRTLRLERIDGPLPPFRPGQYVNVFVDVDGVLTSRPYSISSAPRLGHAAEESRVDRELHTLELTIRDKADGFVAPFLLNEVQVGDELESTGPAGSFYHEPLIDGEELVFLAGGSGITPFMSIIREAFGGDEADSSLKIHLLYGSRVPDDVIFDAELTSLAKAHPGLHYSPVISEPPEDFEGLCGFLDAGIIQEQVGDLAGKTVYICGPNVMYDFCLEALTELGVPGYKIKRELYGPPDDVTKEPGWPEGLDGDRIFDLEVEGQETIRAAAGEPLLNSLERYGIVVPVICRAGECSACRTRLLSGRVYQPASTGLRESDREHGYIHACVSYPLENLRIRL